jgi:enoyl-CoA hydratase
MSDPETEERPVYARLSGARLDVVINRPSKRNALSRASLAMLGDVFTKHATAEVKAAVIRGAGDKSFAAGGDLQELSAVRNLDEAAAMSREGRAMLDAVRRFPVPVVAALNGDALGGGAELAVACDFRVAVGHARIGFLQGRLGITPAWGGSIDLADLVGPQRALVLMARYPVLGAAEAKALGLIDAVAADTASLKEATDDFLAPILALPRHVLISLKAYNRAYRNGIPRAELEALETRCLAEAWVHDDHWRAADAALTRRRS